MFCTTLRRRPSFASVLPSLMSADGLELRENRLDTHDLAIPLGNSSHAVTSTSRQLRVLLLAPSCMSESRLSQTMDRIHHFTSLTGGQDLTIIFLLNPPKTSSFMSAKDLNNANDDLEAGTKGIFAYTQFQASLLERNDIPHVPILPLASSEHLPELLTRHLAALSVEARPALATASSFGMLQLSTAEPPMDRQTAYFVTDCFDNLRGLAVACTEPAVEPTSSSPSYDAGGGAIPQSGLGVSLQRMSQGSDAHGRLAQMRSLVGEQQYQELVDFWLDEWIVE